MATGLTGARFACRTYVHRETEVPDLTAEERTWANYRRTFEGFHDFMPVLISARVDRASGLVDLRFPFESATKDLVKSIPGSRWKAAEKCWRTSIHGVKALKHRGLKIEEAIRSETRAEIPEGFAKRLRPYQIEAANFLIRNGGALLTMDPRTGKTPTAIAAGCALMARDLVDSLIVSYPASVAGEWERQLKDWANLNLEMLHSFTALTPSEIARLRAKPWLVLGCHHEILEKRVRDLHAIVEGRRFGLIVDEVQSFKNRKAGRTKALGSLTQADGQAEFDEELFKTGSCVVRWGLTGTPMRNRPRDLFCLFDFAIPGSMGGYWTYAKRYCNAALGEYGWEDDGASNEDELAERLKAISYRKTRAEVAPWLPKSDRNVIVCSLPANEMKKYRALEGAFAPRAVAGLDDGAATPADREALRALAQATVGGKIGTAVDRAYGHCSRGAKVIVFAQFHESLKTLEESFDTAKERDSSLPIHFCAGGWMTPEKRRGVIATWRACPGAAILLVNTLSSGVGIDLADAEAAIFLELVWVPADLVQAEARIQDVHLGKRVAPPLYEYLVVKDTIDEAMAAALLSKVKNIDAVVGQDAETSGIGSTLRGAGVVGPARLGLPNDDRSTIQAMVEGIRARLLSGRRRDGAEDTALASDATEAFSDDVATDDVPSPPLPSDDIPF